MQAIIMTRVSSQEQSDEGQSLQAQLVKLTQYCERKGFSVLKTYEFVESSTIPERKKFQEMMSFIRKHNGETIALVVDAVDRLQRSFKETTELDAMRLSGKLEMHFLRENLTVHQNSDPNEILRWDFSVLQAKSYVASLSANVKRSTAYMVKDQRFPSRAPIGYMNVQEEGRGNIKLDPERAFLVKKAFTLYASGTYSVKRLTQFLKTEGLTNWTKPHNPLGKSQIHNMLSNPFYYGTMRWKTQLYPHRYERLISRELFDKCQSVLNGFSGNPIAYRTKDFAFRGLIGCGHCDSIYCFESKKGGRYTYGYCTKSRDNQCPAKGVNETVLFKAVEALLKKLKIPPSKEGELLTMVQNIVDSENIYREKTLKVLRAEYASIQQKLDRLLDLQIDGSITRSEYDKKAQTLKARQYEIDDLCRDKTEADDDFKTTISTLLDISQRAFDIFKNSEADQQHRLLKILLPKSVITDGKLHLQAKKPFQQFLDFAQKSKWLPRLDSNQ